MYITTSEYKILSDLWHVVNGDFTKNAILQEKDFSDIMHESAKALDNIFIRHKAQNKKTANYIAKTRKTNKNYAR